LAGAVELPPEAPSELVPQPARATLTAATATARTVLDRMIGCLMRE
jgi:hypothetical protein